MTMKANQKFIKSEDAQIGVGMIGGLVALLITIIVGILIYWQLSGSIDPNVDYINANNDSNAAINSSVSGVNSMSSTVFSLLPIIALVVVASIILGVVMGFSRGGGI